MNHSHSNPKADSLFYVMFILSKFELALKQDTNWYRAVNATKRMERSMTRDEAIAFVGLMVGRIGGGYHPDNKLHSYMYTSNVGLELHTFSNAELTRLQPLHDQMTAILGEEVYEMCLKVTGY